MAKLIFKEVQKFHKLWLIVVVPLAIVIITMPVIYWFLKINYTNAPFSFSNINPTSLAIFASIIISLVVLVLVVVVNSTLKTKICSDKITVSYKLLSVKKNTVLYPDVKSFKILEYRPFIDFVGYGVKNSRKFGKTYIVSGNCGIQLHLKNGKRLFIGTQKKQAIKYALEKFMNQERKKVKWQIKKIH